MLDHIKICDLSVSADALLHHPALAFTGRYSRTTGEIQDDYLTARHRGLTLHLRPRLTRPGYRVELAGSLHYYANGGRHNADDFTAPRLLAVLQDLTEGLGIDPLTSTLNNVEFGVNVGLPFAVGQVLDNLIHYKNRPFSPETGDGFRYHQCEFYQYIVKIYDKGDQYRADVPGLPENLLRVEVKVLKMECLTPRQIHLNTLADLLTVELYPALGALLVEVFTGILFDEPGIDADMLRGRDRDLLLRGRNPRHWILKGLTTAQKKQRQRDERRFRALLNRHRPGRDWQGEVAALIGETWNRLTTVTPALLTAIADQRQTWENCPLLTDLRQPEPERGTVPALPENCPLLTDLPTPPRPGQLSTFDHLDKGSFQDNGEPEPGAAPGDRGTVETAPVVCPVTGVVIAQPRPRQRFLSTAILCTDDGLLLTWQGRFQQYAKGSKENDQSRTAHNVRNRHSNPRNNLRRRIGRVHGQPLLFDAGEVDSMIRLTADQRAALDHWNGTDRELPVGLR